MPLLEQTIVVEAGYETLVDQDATLERAAVAAFLLLLRVIFQPTQSLGNLLIPSCYRPRQRETTGVGIHAW